MVSRSLIAIVLALFITYTVAVPYSKYGRSCKDIGCRSDETCVMAEDPCSSYQRDQCGRYPTCQRSSRGGESCITKICSSGQYCKTENGVPTCVSTVPSSGYDSAGIDNGDSRYAANNPYAHANAPPAEDVNGRYQPPGYPAYPANNNNGYPPYPPVAGQQPNRDSLGYPAYPSSPNNNPYQPNYPNQPNYPGYNNNPYGNNNNRPYSGGYGSNGGYGSSGGYGGYGGYRRNNSSVTSSSLISIFGILFIALLASKQMLQTVVSY